MERIHYKHKDKKEWLILRKIEKSFYFNNDNLEERLGDKFLSNLNNCRTIIEAIKKKNGQTFDRMDLTQILNDLHKGINAKEESHNNRVYLLNKHKLEEIKSKEILEEIKNNYKNASTLTNELFLKVNKFFIYNKTNDIRKATILKNNGIDYVELSVIKNAYNSIGKLKKNISKLISFLIPDDKELGYFKPDLIEKIEGHIYTLQNIQNMLMPSLKTFEAIALEINSYEIENQTNKSSFYKTEMYAAYIKTENVEGYYDFQRNVTYLSEARFFSSKEKAQKFAPRATIVEVKGRVKAIVEDKENSAIDLKTYIEQEDLEKKLLSLDKKRLIDKIAKYESILQENNLLTKKFKDNVKTNKI